MSKIKLSFECESIEVSPNNYRTVDVSADGVEKDRVIDNLSIQDYIDHFGLEAVLDHIGSDAVIDHFGFESE